MEYKILFHKKAQKFFNKLDKPEKKQISKAMDKLKTNPKKGKPLSGNLSGLRSLRITKYRILYKEYEEKLLIFILKLGHRKNIYE